MYSVVAMMAITAGAEAPDCHRYRACGCYCVPAPCVTVYYPPYYYGCCGVVVPVTPSSSGSTSTDSTSTDTSTDDGQPMTEEDVKQLKELGLSDKEVDEMKELKTTHSKAVDFIKKLKSAGGGDQSRRTPAPATITVRLPADATLTIDDAPTTSRSEERTFVSPVLSDDYVYFYTLKAERVVDGVKQTVTEKVTARAGRESAVTLDFSRADVAKK